MWNIIAQCADSFPQLRDFAHHTANSIERQEHFTMSCVMVSNLIRDILQEHSTFLTNYLEQQDQHTDEDIRT